MGVLVNAKSEPSFVLQREDFPRALRGLKKFAKELPDDFEVPEAVAKAKTLADALGDNYWAPRFDDFGDLVSIDYQVDKAPHDATDYWPVPMLEVLAKAGARGWVRFSADDYECSFDLDHDGVGRHEVSSSFALALDGQPPDHAAPGESVRLTIKAGEQITEHPLTVSVHSDWTLSGQKGHVSAQFDAAPMHAGETRVITLELDAQARGGLIVYIEAGEGRVYWTPTIDPSAEEIAKPWTVIDRRSNADRRAMVPKGAIKKTLERVRRYAVRNCERPGAAFLREIAEADSLDAALALAGLELRAAERKQQELVFVADQLPGAELYFTQLLDLLAKSAARWCGVSLSLAFAEAPKLWREYGVRYGDIQCSVKPRVS
jgi:hypothetical protein